MQLQCIALQQAQKPRCWWRCSLCVLTCHCLRVLDLVCVHTACSGNGRLRPAWLLWVVLVARIALCMQPACSLIALCMQPASSCLLHMGSQGHNMVMPAERESGFLPRGKLSLSYAHDAMSHAVCKRGLGSHGFRRRLLIAWTAQGLSPQRY